MLFEKNFVVTTSFRLSVFWGARVGGASPGVAGLAEEEALALVVG